VIDPSKELVISGNLAFTSFIEIEYSDHSHEKMAEGVKEITGRICINCGPHWYYATDVCINTPCGWLCG
jgi:NRPS condensation-like uncharacterized protein